MKIPDAPALPPYLRGPTPTTSSAPDAGADHISLTIAEMEEKLAKLQHCLGLLRELSGRQPAGNGPGPASGSLPGSTARSRIQEQKSAVRNPSHRLRPNFAALVDTIRSLPEPLTPPAIIAAAGRKRGSVSGTIHRLLKRGWLNRTGFGQYERTAKFPAAELPEIYAEAPQPTAATASGVRVPGLDAEELPLPGLDAEELPLSARLEKALHDRDHAVANGHEKLAKILNDKVAKLSAQLEVGRRISRRRCSRD